MRHRKSSADYTFNPNNAALILAFEAQQKGAHVEVHALEQILAEDDQEGIKRFVVQTGVPRGRVIDAIRVSLG